MEKLIAAMGAIPFWILAGVVLILLALLFLFFLSALSRRRLRRDILKLARQPEQAGALARKYGQPFLLANSRLLEKLAQKAGAGFIPLLALDELWVARLRERKGKRDFLRVLQYAPGKGLFQCFLLSLERRRLAPHLLGWLKEAKELLPLRALALTGQGEDFDGSKALELLKEHLEGIREMIGDPEWLSRYFAVKMLLHDGQERSQRACWAAFADPHPLVRRTATLELRSEEKQRLYEQLFSLCLDDPAYEVRSAAWQRIQREFSALYRLEAGKLRQEQVFHLLELLRPEAKEDEEFAFSFLEAEDLELRFAAARFLDRCGSLKRLCLQVDLGDMEALERNYRLLDKAREVNVSSFLSCLGEAQNPATLLVCARLLSSDGRTEWIPILARKAFALFKNQPELLSLYRATVECVAQNGDEESLRLLDEELLRWQKEGPLMELLLSKLPARGQRFFLESLFGFLCDPGFPVKDALRAALKRMPLPPVLEQIFAILKAPREAHPHPVRIEALKLLGELGLRYCLQALLENLPILPAQEAKAYTRTLSQYPPQVFRAKVNLLLESVDARLRAALIASLPVTQDKEFLKSIRSSLKDADPDVRVAAAWALVDYEDFRSLNLAVSLLHDPVERVRRAVAGAFGAYGAEEALGQLREILLSEQEMEGVKRAAIEGLGDSSALLAIDILVEGLAREELATEITGALSKKTDKKQLAHLIEAFKDAAPAGREKLSAVFKAMRESGEKTMVDLLREDIPSLAPFIREILETTGMVDAQIRKLAHREYTVRREAAEFLALVGTQSAFRGMMLAAQDPDEEVRIRVIRALERLEKEEGNAILEALKSDPDRRVRKYTLWALERLKAKSL